MDRSLNIYSALRAGATALAGLPIEPKHVHPGDSGISRPGLVAHGQLSAKVMCLVLLALSVTSAVAQSTDNADLLDLSSIGLATRLTAYALVGLALCLVSIAVPDAPLLAYAFSMSIVQLTGARIALALMQCAIVVLRKGTPRHLAPSWLLSLFLLCATASATWALDPRESLSGELTGVSAMLLQLPITIAVLASLRAQLTTLPRLLSALVLGAVPGCILTIKNALAGVRYLGDQSLSDQNQYYMGFIQPDIFSTILVMGGIFLLFCVASPELKASKRIVAGIVLPLVCVALILTGIRSSWVALGLTTLVLLVRMRNWVSAASVLGLVLVVLVVSFSSTFGLKVNEKISSRLSESSLNTGETRLQYWEVAAQGFAKRPILGIGWGCFPGFAADHTVGTRAATHNIFVRVVCELGVVGLGLFLAWLGALLAKLRSNPFGGLMGLLMLGVLVQGFFLDHFICSHFWLFLGLCEGMRPDRALAISSQAVWEGLPSTRLAPASK